MTDDKPPSSGGDAQAEDPGPRRVAVTDDQDVPLDTSSLARAAATALDALGVPAAAEVGVVLVDGHRMAALKLQAFGERAVTDVLSFPIDDPGDPMPGPVMLGDVVICPAVADRQARALGRSLDDEMTHLLVHGLLHLLGRDHGDARAELAMAAEEHRLLSLVREMAA